jgi:hypothetical protein
MSTTCRNCGSAADSDDTFCGNCGATVTAGQPAPGSAADGSRAAHPPDGGAAYRVQEQPRHTAPPGTGAGYAPPPPAAYAPLAQAGADSRGFLSALFDFSFTSYVTPKVVRVLYILIVAVLSLGAFLTIVATFFTAGPLAGILALIIVPLFYLLALAFYRISLEFFAVIFRVAEDIRALRVRGEIR